MINILNVDATCFQFEPHDLVITDPPYDMSGADLKKALENTGANHYILLISMSQLIELMSIDKSLTLRFDFVWDFVTPKKAKSKKTIHYTHSTGVYITKKAEKSLFDRDGYWPSIIRANRKGINGLSYVKNHEGFIKILQSFRSCKRIIDPFAGSGSVGFAALECNVSAITLNDINTYDHLLCSFSFFK